MFLRHRVGEAIAKIQTRRVHASSPLLVDEADPPRSGRRDRYDFGSKPVDQARHLGREISPRRDDEQLGQRAGGDQDFVFGFKSGETRIGPGLLEDDRHQGRCVDCNHFRAIT